MLTIIAEIGDNILKGVWSNSATSLLAVEQGIRVYIIHLGRHLRLLRYPFAFERNAVGR